MTRNLKGFTLVELMVSISILVTFFVGGTVYYNNFITRQKLEKAKTEVESMLRLAASYARTRQVPTGYSGGVNYITLSNNSGTIQASINGTGSTYFSNRVSEDGLTITFNPLLIYFWGGSGQLSNNTDINNPSFFGPSQMADVRISISQGVAETRTIFIDSLGNIR